MNTKGHTTHITAPSSLVDTNSSTSSDSSYTGSSKKLKKETLEQLALIKSMMERSTRFQHLSGLAGILAGILALINSYIAIVHYAFLPDTPDYPFFLQQSAVSEWDIILLALGTLLLAMTGSFILSTRNAKKQGEKLWTATTRNLLGYFLVPLLTGGVLMLILWEQGYIGLAAPLSLIFYGLALIHASHFSLSDIQYLGYIQLSIGVASILFMALSIYFWALGFGLVHICYGGYIYLRYERREQ